jgi:[ribosomal protein S18]-alanine N-acetyltransferase
MSLFFEPMNMARANQLVHWRYDAPYDVYNSIPSATTTETLILWFANPQNSYYSVLNIHGELIAFCCFGEDAQVPGGDYANTALDVGLGVRPDLTGQGQGPKYIAAVLNFAQSKFYPILFRVTVAAFNKRALQAWKKAGFQEVQTFQRQADGQPFVVLLQ